MRIHVGCEISFDFPQTTPMILTLNVHSSRVSDLERPDVAKPGRIAANIAKLPGLLRR
jgi:hypothetical protein